MLYFIEVSNILSGFEPFSVPFFTKRSYMLKQTCSFLNLNSFPNFLNFYLITLLPVSDVQKKAFLVLGTKISFDIICKMFLLGNVAEMPSSFS